MFYYQHKSWQGIFHLAPIYHQRPCPLQTGWTTNFDLLPNCFLSAKPGFSKTTAFVETSSSVAVVNVSFNSMFQNKFVMLMCFCKPHFLASSYENKPIYFVKWDQRVKKSGPGVVTDDVLFSSLTAMLGACNCNCKMLGACNWDNKE